MKLTVRLVDFTTNSKPFSADITLGIVKFNYKTFTMSYPKDFCNEPILLLKSTKRFSTRLKMNCVVDELEGII